MNSWRGMGLLEQTTRERLNTRNSMRFTTSLRQWENSSYVRVEKPVSKKDQILSPKPSWKPHRTKYRLKGCLTLILCSKPWTTKATAIKRFLTMLYSSWTLTRWSGNTLWIPVSHLENSSSSVQLSSSFRAHSPTKATNQDLKSLQFTKKPLTLDSNTSQQQEKIRASSRTAWRSKHLRVTSSKLRWLYSIWWSKTISLTLTR